MEKCPRLVWFVGLVVLAALAGCGSDGATTTTVTAGSPTANVAILGCQGNLKDEPVEVNACAADDGINVDHVEWTGWGEDPAYGRGRAIVNTCEPDCAAGNYNIFRVVLMATGLKPCKGTQVYRTIRFAVIEVTSTPPIPPGELIPPDFSECD